MNDAWNPPNDGGSGRGDYGGVSVMGGLPSRQVFEPTVLFRLGWAVLKEQPTIVLVGGLCLFGAQVLPSLAAMPLEFATTAYFASMSEDNPAEGLWSTLLTLFAAPFNILLVAGLQVAVARWVQRGEADLGTIFTSVRPALRLVSATIALFLLMIPMMLVACIPLVGVFLVAGALGPAVASVAVMLVGFALLVSFIWVQLGFSLVQVSAVLDEGGPFDAIQASWRAARGARIVLLASILAIALAAALSCCLALVPLIPLLGGAYAAYATAWLLHSRPTSETSEWAFVRRNDFGALYD